MKTSYAELAVDIIEKAKAFDYDTKTRLALIHCGHRLAMADAIGRCADAIEKLGDKIGFLIDEAIKADKA